MKKIYKVIKIIVLIAVVGYFLWAVSPMNCQYSTLPEVRFKGAASKYKERFYDYFGYDSVAEPDTTALN